MTSTPARSGMPGHFGIRITDADKGKLVGELDVDDRHLNNSGHVHGGALAAFADDLGGALAGLNVSPGFRTTTIESKTNIFRACVPGRLTGVAVPVHVGRRTIVLQTSIYPCRRKACRDDDSDADGAPEGGRPHRRVKAAMRLSALTRPVFPRDSGADEKPSSRFWPGEAAPTYSESQAGADVGAARTQGCGG